MRFFLQLLPAPLIRYAGRLQFRMPFLRGLINRVGQSLAGSGVILRGEGRGLRFNATGCNPGYLAGTSVPEEQALVARHSHRGGVVYDLGANAGFYAMIAARQVGPEGAVYAFEPTPALAERIRENAALNGFENVHVIEAAVSDADGVVRFGVAGPLSVKNSLQSAASGPSIEVRTLRLDTFCKTHPHPSLLLMDIEGAELAALQGARQMLASSRPVVMVEVHWLGEDFLNFVEAEMKPLGYAATTYDGSPLPSELTRYHALLLPGIRRL